MIKSTASIKSWSFTHPAVNHESLVISAPIYNGNLVIMMQDSKHLKKTLQNNIFLGAWALVLGDYIVGYHHIQKIGMGGVAPNFQSTTLHTELCASPNISEALPHTLMHCVVDSANCTLTVLPPASMPPHMLLLVCLFICLPLSLAHMLPSLFVYFPFPLFLILTGSGLMLSLTVPVV